MENDHNGNPDCPNIPRQFDDESLISSMNRTTNIDRTPIATAGVSSLRTDSILQNYYSIFN